VLGSEEYLFGRVRTHGPEKRRGFWLACQKAQTDIPGRENALEARILAGCRLSGLPLPFPMSDSKTHDSPVTRLWSFIRAILDLVLDLSFKRLVTPKLIRVVYALSLVGAVIYTWRWIDGFLGFVTAPLAFLAYAIVARVIVELILVIFRIAEKIAPLDENAPQEEDVLSKLKK